MQWFFANGSEQKGPYTLQEIAAVGLRPDTLVWCEGMPQWQRADSVLELNQAQAELASETPVSSPPHPVPQPFPQPAIDYHMPTTARPTDGLAVASMVLGIISLPTMCAYGLGIIPAILAVIFGFIARNRIKRGESDGESMALTGLICGFISLLLMVVGIVLLMIGVAVAMFR
jgi:hypothetical protein